MRVCGVNHEGTKGVYTPACHIQHKNVRIGAHAGRRYGGPARAGRGRRPCLCASGAHAGRPRGAPLRIHHPHFLTPGPLRSAGGVFGTRFAPTIRRHDRDRSAMETSKVGDVLCRTHVQCLSHRETLRYTVSALKVSTFNVQRSTFNVHLPPATCNPHPPPALTRKKGTLLLLHSLVIGAMILAGARISLATSISL